MILPSPPFRYLAALLGLLTLAACTSPSLEDRIAANQEAYESWSPEVREAIASGRIETGFYREQVEMAWGEPDRVTTSTTEDGRVESWIYEKGSPAFSIGLGAGSFGGRTGVSGGVGTTIGGDTNIIALARFQDGQVISFERAG